MSARDTIAHARDLGVPLGETEARVALAPEAPTSSRAWFGTDYHNRPVAYFEIGDQTIDSFAVSQVIDVTPVRTTIGASAEAVRTAKVTCRESRLDDVFIAFMDDVVEQLGTADAVSILVESAASWRNLLRLARSGLTDSASMGLFGELKFLESLLGVHGPSAVDYWQRESNSIHDFIGERVRVEVKSSTFQNQQAVQIHGLRQLEVPKNGRLILAVADIEKHGGGQTLDDLVDSLLDGGADMAALTTKLNNVGFVRGMNTDDSSPSFTIIGWRFWEITEESPVLNSSTVGAQITEAISNLQYSLNLAALGNSTTQFDWHSFAESAGH